MLDVEHAVVVADRERGLEQVGAPARALAAGEEDVLVPLLKATTTLRSPPRAGQHGAPEARAVPRPHRAVEREPRRAVGSDD
jgi:hypothetical protein